MPYQPGDLLAGRYRLDDRIASGGMGDVWLAADTVLGRQVAVKTLRADRAIDPQFQTRFEHEARAMAALHHPGIVDVYDFGREPGSDAYLVMAHVHGQPLDQRIAEQGRLTLADTLAVVTQVGHALQAVHDAGIVHRDVKPANMIIRPDGTVVLVDFGVARSSGSAALTGAKDVIGTANYIAPEQVSKTPVGAAADVYALGAVAYHCLSGHPPFLGDNPVTIALQHVTDEPPPLPDDVPPPVRELVTTALAKDPAARYPSAAAMAAAADRAAGAAPAADETVTLAVDSMRTGYAPAGRRTPILVAVALSLALLGTGAVLAVTDPFGWFPGVARPATSEPATPSAAASATRSPRPGGGTVDGGATRGPTRTPTSPPRTSSRTPNPNPPTSAPTATTTPATTSTPARPTTPPTQAEPSGPPPAAARRPAEQQ